MADKEAEEALQSHIGTTCSMSFFLLFHLLNSLCPNGLLSRHEAPRLRQAHCQALGLQQQRLSFSSEVPIGWSTHEHPGCRPDPVTESHILNFLSGLSFLTRKIKNFHYKTYLFPFKSNVLKNSILFHSILSVWPIKTLKILH